MIVIRRSYKWLRPQVSAMARPAGHRHVRVRHLGDVLHVDVFQHLVHHTRGALLFLGVVGVVELRFAVGRFLGGIRPMAGTAAHAQASGPLVHDLADLLAGQILGQDLQVGGRGKLVRWTTSRGWRRICLWGLPQSKRRKSSRQSQGDCQAGKWAQGSFQAGVLLWERICFLDGR